jgi:hypothetical protein
MNALTIQRLTTKLHKELPKLGSVCVERNLWFDKTTSYKNHANSHYRISVFDSSGNYISGSNIAFDASYKLMEQTIREIYNIAFPLAVV